MPTTSHDHAADFAADQLDARIMELRHEHAARTPAEARAISRAAVTRWGEPVPTALALDPAEIARKHGATWRADAEAGITVQDWRAFGDRGRFVVLDFEQLGITEPRAIGFAVGEHLQTIARDKITARKPAEAVAIDTVAIANLASRIMDKAPTTTTPTSLAAVSAALVFGVVAHERAHVLAAQVKGTALPADHSLERVAAELPLATQNDRRWKHHGPEWVRAYLHVVARARGTCAGDIAHGLLDADLQELRLGKVEAFENELANEIREAGDCRILDVLRTPTPEAFLELFAERSAARERGDTHDRNAA